MVPPWDDTKSFQKHLDAMKTFRQSHSAPQSEGQTLTDVPPLCIIDLSQGERLIMYLPTPDGLLVFIPIWKIIVTQDCRN